MYSHWHLQFASESLTWRFACECINVSDPALPADICTSMCLVLEFEHHNPATIRRLPSSYTYEASNVHTQSMMASEKGPERQMTNGQLWHQLSGLREIELATLNCDFRTEVQHHDLKLIGQKLFQLLGTGDGFMQLHVLQKPNGSHSSLPADILDHNVYTVAHIKGSQSRLDKAGFSSHEVWTVDGHIQAEAPISIILVTYLANL